MLQSEQGKGEKEKRERKAVLDSVSGLDNAAEILAIRKGDAVVLCWRRGLEREAGRAVDEKRSEESLIVAHSSVTSDSKCS